MSGHNKWSKIRHKKARVDKARSKVWSSVAHDIITAARIGGGDPSANLRLQYAVDEAKRANMPADTVDRAIKRGTGEIEGAAPEELMYEGYGPGGVAIMVQALTDNRNRTAPVVKRLFERHGGKMGSQGSVAYLFATKGKVVIPKSAIGEDALMELALDAGADDVDSRDETTHDVICEPSALEPLKQILRAKNIQWESAKIAQIPTTTTLLDVETAQKVLKLVEALDDEDDVQNVFGNFEISDDVLAKMADS